MVQYWSTSSSCFSSKEPQIGQVVIGLNAGNSSFLFALIEPNTLGMISPALNTWTSSPILISFSIMYSALWSVALETIEPDNCTGSNSATYVILPVLPTVALMFFNLVLTISGGNL